ncbi:putative aminoadipate reductase [Chiua virens]|nr:putative aminoadipate reductase [Chiua virens]
MTSVSFRQSHHDVSYPPLDGSLFLQEMIEFNATHNPSRTFYTFYDERINGLRHVSHLEFYRACQRIAHVVRPNGQGPTNAVIAIISNCDTILYQALTMGVIFAGHTPFPMSPRNSAAAVVNMMRKTGCRRIIATSHSLGTLLDGIRIELASGVEELNQIEIDEPPTLAFAYPELGKETTSSPFAPYPKLDERPANDAIMYYLHSSGSTRFPKPIPITYLTAVHWCITPSVLEHVDFPTDIRIGAASLPPFHTLGMYVQLYYPIVSLKTVTIGPNRPQLVVVPAFLEEWVNAPQVVQVLSKLEYVTFAGGPLAKKTGDALVAAGVKLASVYGTTEFSAITYTFRSCRRSWTLWEWVRFGPNQRIRWVAQGDGTYECQVLTCPTHQVSVENLPDVKGYASCGCVRQTSHHRGTCTKSLVDWTTSSSIRRVRRRCLRRWRQSSGRVRMCRACACLDEGRNQTGGARGTCEQSMLIDVTDDERVAEFRNKIWRDVEEANKVAPAFSRVFKEMILVTNKEKPMLQIDALYASVEASAQAGTDVPLPSTWSHTEVEYWLAVHATAVNAGKPIAVDEDVFEQGFDSLSSTFLRNRILGSLSASTHREIREAVSRIGQNVIFANPTLRRLASHLIHCVVGEGADVSLALPVLDMKTEIENMVAKYTVGMGDDAKVGDGMLGTLNGRFNHKHTPTDDVAIVYAFNRPSTNGHTIRQRQRAAFQDRGLDITLLDSEKLIYVQGDAAQAHLGLDDQTYGEIRDAVTAIVHNAWRLDFNLALSSFEPHVRGTRHLIDLARASCKAHKPRFLFTSSIASAQGWAKTKGAFPEEVQVDAGVAVGAGYGASKYVSERILAMSGLPATSLRIGQITGGAPRGAWSTSDWVPIIVKSSVSLGALPEARGIASWLPPHAVSDAMLDVAFADEEPPLAVNLVHPRPIAWESLMPAHSRGTVSEASHVIATSFNLVQPMGRAIERVRSGYERGEYQTCGTCSIRTGSIYKTCARLVTADFYCDQPAIKLLEFMRSLAESDVGMRRRSGAEMEEAVGFTRFATDVAQGVSKTMRELKPLSAMDATQWVDYWVSAGMFSG